MDKPLKEKLYMISGIILAIMAFIIFNIIIINEDKSWKILPPIFALIAFGISFPSSIVSEKLMNFGDKIANKLVKILFYIIAMPVCIFVLFLAMYTIITFIVDALPTPNELGAALGQGLLILFFIAIGTIGILVPYIQTLIVLILKQFIKK